MISTNTQQERLDEIGARESTTPRERANVWVLDDSPLEGAITARALAAEFVVETFTESTMLLERFANDAAPSVLVLDWELPHISGVEVCRAVRSSRDPIALPILMLTARRAGSEDLVEALAAGANDHVTKPFVPSELVARVRTLANVRGLYERARLAEQERTDALAHATELAAERDLAIQALREEGLFRERFLGILGHDLRTPLSAILLTGQMLARRAGVTDATLDAARRIVKSSRRMERMIQDLLDFTRTRSGSGMPIVPREADLGAICVRVVGEVHAANPERTITNEAIGDLRGEWDPDRLEQVVANLLVNALEYGTPGTAVQTVVRGDEATVTFAVTNQGRPIPEAVVPTLFDPFRRGEHRVATRAAQGLGLGLYIVQQIVESHAGTIDVLSTERDGTTFSVRLPRARDATPRAATTP